MINPLKRWRQVTTNGVPVEDEKLREEGIVVERAIYVLARVEYQDKDRKTIVSYDFDNSQLDLSEYI
jgi:hypothetical protein